MAVVLARSSPQYGLGSIALVTVMAGLVLLVAGVTGLGRAVTFIPWPVIEGFTLGIAVIIFLQQAARRLSESLPPSVTATLAAAWHVVSTADWLRPRAACWSWSWQYCAPWWSCRGCTRERPASP